MYTSATTCGVVGRPVQTAPEFDSLFVPQLAASSLRDHARVARQGSRTGSGSPLPRHGCRFIHCADLIVITTRPYTHTHSHAAHRQPLMNPEARNIFFLGLGILFGWMIIILICASPQLFRDLIKRRCGSHSKRKQRAEKIRKAEARVIATRALAEKPNAFLLGQVMAISSFSPNRINSCSVQLDLDLEHEDDAQLAQPGPSSA